MKGIDKLLSKQVSPVLFTDKINPVKRSKSEITISFIIIFFLAFTFCASASADINPTFNMTVKNILRQPGPNNQDSIITFELYLQQTNQSQPGVFDFEYCCAQYTFRYNKLIHSPGGNLVFGIVPNASGLPPELRPPSFQVDSVNGFLKASGNLPNSLANYFISGTYPGTKILTFKLKTNNKTFNMVPLNLKFKLGNAPNTFPAFFIPYPDSVDSEQFPSQYAFALLDTVINHYSVEDSSSAGLISLFAPPENSSISLKHINFSWQSVNAVSYKLQISTDLGFNNIVYSDTTLQSANTTVTGLLPGNTYYWRVSAKNDSVYFANSNISAFNVSAAQISLINPANNQTMVSIPVTFTWRKAAQASAPEPVFMKFEEFADVFYKQSNNAESILSGLRSNSNTTYKLEISTDPNFNNITFIDSAITDSFKTVNYLSFLTNYYWRVTPENDSAFFDVSQTWTFRTFDLLINPLNNSSNHSSSTNFIWHNINAEKYLLQISTDSLLTNIIYSDSTITDTNKTVSGLNLSTRYYWKISAKNDSAYFTVSQIWNFTTHDLLNNPPNNSYGNSSIINFRWYNVNADAYLLQISTDPGMTNFIYNDFVTDTLKTVGNFILGRRYYWKVSARNDSAYFLISSIWTFVIYDFVGPVEMSGFSSNVIKDKVTLIWSTSAEINNSGFDIERSDVKSQRSDDWRRMGNVTGNGTSTTGHNYSFTDKNLNSGKYKYRLKQIDYNGNFEYYYLSKEIEVGIPDKYSISQNYPNPFNPSTKIDFDLPADGKVSILIYDISGREIDKSVNEFKPAGYYSFIFNASDLPSGIYFYTITANEFLMTKKMVLVR